MTVQNLYSVMDNKQNMFGPLMCFKNDDTATRSFQEMLISSEDNSLLTLYPTDFTLFNLGLFNKETGLVTSSVPRVVITGYEAITRAINEVNQRNALQKALREGVVPPGHVAPPSPPSPSPSPEVNPEPSPDLASVN